MVKEPTITTIYCDEIIERCNSEEYKKLMEPYVMKAGYDSDQKNGIRVWGMFDYKDNRYGSYVVFTPVLVEHLDTLMKESVELLKGWCGTMRLELQAGEEL